MFFKVELLFLEKESDAFGESNIKDFSSLAEGCLTASFAVKIS